MSSPSSSSRSSRIRRPPPVFGNAVSSDQAYGSDDDCALDDEDEESDGWGGEASSPEVSDFDDGAEEGSDASGKQMVKKASKVPKVAKKAARTKAAKASKSISKISAPASKTTYMFTPKGKTQTLLPAFAKPLAAKAKAVATKNGSGSGFKPLLQRPKDGPKAGKNAKKANGHGVGGSREGASEAAKSETEDTKEDTKDDSHESNVNSHNNSNIDSKGEDENAQSDDMSDISEDPNLSSLDDGDEPDQMPHARQTIGGRAPTVHTIKKPSVSSSAAHTSKASHPSIKSAAKPLLKPNIKPLVKADKSVSVKPRGKNLLPTVKSKTEVKTGVISKEPKSEDDDEAKGDVSVKADDVEGEDADPSSSFGNSASSSPAKRKRSGGSDGPRKLAPAEKVTPEMRRGIVDLFLSPDYMNKVDFTSVGSAFPDQTTGKLKRHWREVLGPDARAFVRDGSPRAGRPSPKGGLGKAHRKAIWDAVAKAYEGARWGQLEAECGMTATKLRRHFRDVLKKDVANMIARE